MLKFKRFLIFKRYNLFLYNKIQQFNPLIARYTQIKER